MQNTSVMKEDGTKKESEARKAKQLVSNVKTKTKTKTQFFFNFSRITNKPKEEEE